MATKHGAIVIALGGPSSDGPQGDPSTLGTIRLPKGFDAGDAQPGDEIEVTCKVKLSDDGRTADVVSVDGHESDNAQDNNSDSGEDETPGDRWAKIRRPSFD